MEEGGGGEGAGFAGAGPPPPPPLVLAARRALHALLHEGVPVAPPSAARGGRKYVLRTDICYTMPYRGSAESK